MQSITSTIITSAQPLAWFRAVQIVSDAISLILSTLLIVIGFPVIAAGSIILLLSIILFTIGIERVDTGIMFLRLYSTSPPPPTTTSTKTNTTKQENYFFYNIGLCALAIVFAIIAVILSNLPCICNTTYPVLYCYQCNV